MKKRSRGLNSIIKSTIANQCFPREVQFPKRRSRLGLAVLSASLVSPPLVAAELEEVLVTATRRSESLTDVPYNISAVTSEQLENSRVGEIGDLAGLIPGMAFVDTGPSNRGGNNNIVLRGMNANPATNNDGFSSISVAPVSVYLGETPLFLPLQIRDIKRVEVLKGPQGTLYGSGSLAGTIRFIPNKPDPEGFYGDFSIDAATVAESNETNHSFFGTLNVPLSENAAIRLSGGLQHWAGFIDQNALVEVGDPSTAVLSPVGVPTPADPANINSGFLLLPEDEDSNDADVWHLRAALLWEPNDKLSLSAVFHHQEDEVENPQADFRDFAGGNVDLFPAEANIFSPNVIGPVSFASGGTSFRANDEYDVSKLINEPSERSTDLFALDVTYDLGFASLMSSTSYYEDEQDWLIDLSGYLGYFGNYYGFLPRFMDFNFNKLETEGVVQEFRVASTWDKPVDFVVGVFYQNIENKIRADQYVPGQTQYDALSFGIAANPQLGDVNLFSDDNRDFKDLALFGEVTWHVTDRFDLTGGIRIFEQEFSVEGGIALPFCGPFCADNQLGFAPVSSEQDINDELFKINAAYKLTDNSLIYATYSEGFRRGGANNAPIVGPFSISPDLMFFEPDFSYNHEIGIKGTLGSHRYTIAAFQIDWENVQVNDAAAAGGWRLTANGEDAESRGLEVELTGYFGEKLRYSLGYAHIEAQIKDAFAITDIAYGAPVDIISTQAGDPLPSGPEDTLTFALDYSHDAPILDDWQLRWHVNGFYRSETTSGLVSLLPGDPQPFEIDGFAVWDASLNLQSNRKAVSISMYIENIGNERAETGGVDQNFAGPRAAYFFVGRPRTVGLRLNYSFGR